jgi:hypothetical protein
MPAQSARVRSTRARRRLTAPSRQHGDVAQPITTTKPTRDNETNRSVEQTKMRKRQKRQKAMCVLL